MRTGQREGGQPCLHPRAGAIRPDLSGRAGAAPYQLGTGGAQAGGLQHGAGQREVPAGRRDHGSSGGSVRDHLGGPGLEGRGAGGQG